MSGRSDLRRASLGSVAIVLALAAAAGCGGDGGGTAAGKTGPGETDAANGGVVQVEDRPETTRSLAGAQEASIWLPGSPDWLASHGGLVWVKRDDGIVTRIDPAANRPNGEVRADTRSEQLCQGIGAGGGAVWSCSGSDVVRIDPKRLEVTGSIPVGKVFDQGRLVFAGGHIWVLSGEGDRLVGIDAATARIGPSVELPVPCTELGPGAERDLWVGSAGSLVRVDLETREPVAQFANLDLAEGGDLALDGENVWVRTEAGFLHRIDAGSNTVGEQIEPANGLSGGAVLLAAGSLWTTAYDDNLVLRLRAGG